MAWRSFVNAMGHLFIAISVAIVLSFIMLNLAVGCDDWDKPNCITPAEIIGVLK